MKPTSVPRASPSPSLLHFLRAQTEAHFESTTLASGRFYNAAFQQRTLRINGCRNISVHATCRPSLGPVSDPAVHHKESQYTLRQRITGCRKPGILLSCQRRHFFNLRLSKLRRLFWVKDNDCSHDPHTAGHSPLPAFLDDSNDALRRRLRATNDQRLRCTEFDEHGNVTLVNGEFKKTDLIAKYGLLPRDLRKIDSSLLPHVLIRPSAILLNLLHLRVLIKHDRVLVFDAYGTTDSYNQSSFMYDIDQKLRQKESPQNGTLAYEFRALEACLLSVTNSLESEFEGVSQPVVRVLRDLEEDIDRDKLRYLLMYSKKLGTFEQRARLVRDALTEILEADDDLSSMYLTEKSQGVQREEDDDHTDIEMLLESYHKVADEIVQAAENLVSNIRNTEEIVKAILDANRNSLMLLDLRFSVFTLGITAGTFVAALYGMNLKNFIEESDLGFPGVSLWCTVCGIVVCVWGIQKLRKVQRVSMYGEHGRRIALSRTELGAGTTPRSIEIAKEKERNVRGWERRLRETERARKGAAPAAGLGQGHDDMFGKWPGSAGAGHKGVKKP
ncbi:cora-domain-containing protein, partial [Pseudovirgaria hyperparasitica]